MAGRRLIILLAIISTATIISFFHILGDADDKLSASRITKVDLSGTTPQNAPSRPRETNPLHPPQSSDSSSPFKESSPPTSPDVSPTSSHTSTPTPASPIPPGAGPTASNTLAPAIDVLVSPDASPIVSDTVAPASVAPANHSRDFISTQPGSSPKSILSIGIFLADFSRLIELHNLKHFCMYGIRVNDSMIDYEIILVANEAFIANATLRKLYELEMPTFVRTAPNVHIRWRTNQGTDFCTLVTLSQEPEFAAKVFNGSRGKNYTHFWLMNGTVRGPFLPTWMLIRDIPWWEPFFAEMEAPPLVDVVCSYGSCEANRPHCQSMALMLTRRAFDLALSTLYCQKPGQTRIDWIYDTEIVRSEPLFPPCLSLIPCAVLWLKHAQRFSERLLEKGMNAKTLLGVWGGLDLRTVSAMSSEARKLLQICQPIANPYVATGYSGTYPNPLETVFYKLVQYMISLIPSGSMAFMQSRERIQLEVVSSLRPEILALRNSPPHLSPSSPPSAQQRPAHYPSAAPTDNINSDLAPK